MGDPALAKSNDPLSVEGLEDVFDTSEVSANSSDHLTESATASSEPEGFIAEATSEVFGTGREILTTTEAASRLGISPRAIINRIKAGTLAGHRTKGKYKDEWRVYWNDLPNHSEESAAEHVSSSEQTEADAEKTPEHFRTASELNPGEQLLADLLSAHTEQIRTQNDLIRYLTEQLKEKDQQIHLLSDRQHNRGWFQRFSSWFLGQKNQY